MHRRLIPFRHRFDYRVFSLLINLDELPLLDRRLAGFSHNGFNLLSFQDRDHGARDGSPLRPWVEAQLHRAGLDFPGGRISLLCFPRILGLVFNPLSIYFCRDDQDRLRAILYEVKNTFGQQHGYLLPVAEAHQADDVIVQRQDKAFYVSPFMPMECRYRFRLKEPGERLSIMIRQESAAEKGPEMLIASQVATREALTGRSLLAAFLRHPLMSLKIIGGIHWEALRLWRKGAAFHTRPSPPLEDVTVWQPPLSVRSTRH